MYIKASTLISRSPVTSELTLSKCNSLNFRSSILRLKICRSGFFRERDGDRLLHRRKRDSVEGCALPGCSSDRSHFPWRKFAGDDIKHYATFGSVLMLFFDFLTLFIFSVMTCRFQITMVVD